MLAGIKTRCARAELLERATVGTQQASVPTVFAAIVHWLVVARGIELLFSFHTAPRNCS